MGKLEALVKGGSKNKKRKNADLFADLKKARDKHFKVVAEVVPWDKRDAEHEEAMASVRRLIDQVKAKADFGEPMPVHRARNASVGPVTQPDASRVDAQKAVAFELSKGAVFDLPWYD